MTDVSTKDKRCQKILTAHPSGRAVFESCRVHGCLSLVGVVCRQVEFIATGRSLVRSPTDCSVTDSGTEIVVRVTLLAHTEIHSVS